MHTSLMTLVSALGLAACQPTVDTGEDPDEDAWALGTWSTRGPGTASTGVTHYRFEPDGTLESTEVGGCGSEMTEAGEYRWRVIEPDTVEVTDIDGSPMDDWDGGPVHFVLRDVCDGGGPREHISVVWNDGPETIGGATNDFTRGEVCLEELPPPDDPDSVETDSCRTVWCDGEPPATLPCLP